MGELDIFKKHLGEFESKGEFDAKQFCSQISDVNDFIGALQVLDLNLKKIHKNISERITDVELDDTQKRMIDASTSQLIQSCSFMGTSLFDSNFNVCVDGCSFGFQIQNPLLVLEKSDYNGVLAYVEDKREEISSLLADLVTAITSNVSTSNSNFVQNSTNIGSKTVKYN